MRVLKKESECNAVFEFDSSQQMINLTPTLIVSPSNLLYLATRGTIKYLGLCFDSEL
jgi:hypothetical protein